MSRRNLEQQKETVIRFVRQKQTPTVSDITSITKINVARVFGSIRKAYAAAGVPYGKKPKDVKHQEIINHIKKNNLATINEINKAVNCSFYKYFISLKSACKIAGVRYYDRHTKRTERKRQEVLIYIRKRPEATQREVNSACKTKVQETFTSGIREAYEKAGVSYDITRRNIHGAALSQIKESAVTLEKNIAGILRENFGENSVFEQVKINDCRIDIVLELNDKKFVIEVKDYKHKPISWSEIKQIKRYLKALNAKTGVIVTTRKLNKTDEINNIRIFETSETDKLLSFLKEKAIGYG
ncbi:MAG: restriction endonuclease [DPANN group archaeon]|nr:restriction endonuclease [DPANN group archaeon]